MFRLKIVLFTSVLALIFSGCLPQLKTKAPMEKMTKSTDYLIETKDINNIKELEVSNNLIQILPVISISGVQVLFDEMIKDEKIMFFRNEKCIFQGIASSDLTTKRVKVHITKATCKPKYNQKVNYMVNGWILGKDESFGLKASKEILNPITEDYDEDMPQPKERVILMVNQGEYAYVSLDMVKQLETIVDKNKMKMQMKPKQKTGIITSPSMNQKTRLIKMN